MTFGFIFTRTRESPDETCYRLTIPDETYLSRVKTLKHYFKNNMDSCIEVCDKSFLDTSDSLVHTIGPVGQFVEIINFLSAKLSNKTFGKPSNFEDKTNKSDCLINGYGFSTKS